MFNLQEIKRRALSGIESLYMTAIYLYTFYSFYTTEMYIHIFIYGFM